MEDDLDVHHAFVAVVALRTKEMSGLHWGLYSGSGARIGLQVGLHQHPWRTGALQRGDIHGGIQEEL